MVSKQSDSEECMKKEEVSTFSPYIIAIDESRFHQPSLICQDKSVHLMKPKTDLRFLNE